MTTLKITGMTCGHCARSVTEALQAVPGVVKAEVSLPKGEARVEGAAELGALIAAVKEEGYGAEPLS
ncbi:MAG TPA: cation transporter [Holophagaceae bacterium]|nr:cation transporter [Holophagaceae bacterium]